MGLLVIYTLHCISIVNMLLSIKFIINSVKHFCCSAEYWRTDCAVSLSFVFASASHTYLLTEGVVPVDLLLNTLGRPDFEGRELEFFMCFRLLRAVGGTRILCLCFVMPV